jgi:aminopeptidase YwaD
LSEKRKNIAIRPEAVQERLQHIAKQIGTRLGGSEQEQQAADYMARQMKKSGLDVEIVNFPALSWSYDEAHLRVSVGDKWRETGCQPVAHSPSTPVEGIEAPLINLGTATDCELRGKDLRGKIGFMFGLTGDQPAKLKRLCNSGLLALLMVDERLPMPWAVHAGLPAGWIDLLTIPAATVAYTEAWEIAKLRNSTAYLNLQTSVWESQSQNVIGSFSAQDSSLPPLILTCHHDSVALGEGAEDDGSGMAVVLAVAQALGRGKPPRPIKIISCGWEENLSEGARQYVVADIERARQTALVINIDSVGSWMGRTCVNVVGDESMRRWAEQKLDALGFCAQVVHEVSPYSDMFPFNMVGVPSLWFYRPNLYDCRFYHHSTEDTLDKISFDLLAETANAIADLVWHLGGSRELPFERAIPAKQVDQIAQYRSRLLDTICDWRTTGLMKPKRS